MDKGRRKRLSWRLHLALSSVIITAAVLMHLSNRYLSRYPPELLAFNIKALIIIFGLWILILGFFIRIRLKPYLQMRDNVEKTSDHTAIWELLTRFPGELFRLTIVLGLAAAGGYKLAERNYMSMIDIAVSDEAAWFWLIRGLVLNLSSTLLIAAVYYGLARLILRPCILQLQRIDVSRVSFRSFSGSLIFTFVIVMAMVIIRILWYIMNSGLQQQPIQWQVLFYISLIGLLGGLLLFYLIAIGYRRQTQTMEARIGELIRDGKAGTPRKVAVTANDDTGELAAVLNDLQTRLSREYAEMEEELQLARKVRDRLFPQPQARCGKLDIAFRVRTGDEPGGEFYDLAEMDDRHTIIIAGRVPEKGAAAVLMVSALLALFRTETGRSFAASAILNRLLAAWSESFPELGSLSAGVAVMDRFQSTVAVALTGNASVRCTGAEASEDTLLLKASGDQMVAEAFWETNPGESFSIGPARKLVSPGAEGRHEALEWVQITRR